MILPPQKDCIIFALQCFFLSAITDPSSSCHITDGKSTLERRGLTLVSSIMHSRVNGSAIFHSLLLVARNGCITATMCSPVEAVQVVPSSGDAGH